MGDQSKQDGEKQNDRYELGVSDVRSANDLAPESGVGPSRAHREEQRLSRPQAEGLFEEQAVSLGTSIAGPLLMDSWTLQDGGGRLAEYQAGYNAYAAPLRSTVRGMGRVKDLSLTGAPKTPDELRANPALAKRFRKLSLANHDDAGAQTAFDAWSSAQTRMAVDTSAFGAGQAMLKSSLENWHSVQALLKHRQAEAERGSKQAELTEVNEAAATLAKIVEVSAEAWAAVGEVTEAMEAVSALDSNAEGLMPGEEAAENVGSRGANALKKADTAKAGIADATDIVRRSAGFLQKASGGAKLSLSLEDVFVIAMGNGKKKVELENDITKLTAQMAKLNIVAADWHIKEGRTRLDAFKCELVVRRTAVQADRRAARAAASTFNQSLTGGAGTEGQMAMYMVEAQQERLQFAEFAQQARVGMVDPHWQWADAYINDNYSRIAGHGHADDATKLATNLMAVRDQRAFFAKNLPEWEHTAHAWQQFLVEVTQKPLTSGPSEIDRKSDAP